MVLLSGLRTWACLKPSHFIPTACCFTCGEAHETLRGVPSLMPSLGRFLSERVSDGGVVIGPIPPFVRLHGRMSRIHGEFNRDLGCCAASNQRASRQRVHPAHPVCFVISSS